MEPWWQPDPPLPGGRPGSYALVIGVSEYTHLPPAGEPSTEEWANGLCRLECAAVTAADVTRWLREAHYLPDAPLAGVWLLSSPSAVEIQLLTNELDAPPATATNVFAALEAWKAACRSHPNNVAILYAAGHGFGAGRYEPGVLLLEDFGADPEALLSNALSMTKVHATMAASPGGAPERQFSFFDACRARPELALCYDLGEAPPLWTPPLGTTAAAAPMFLGAATGARAYGMPGTGTLFWQALRACLEHDAVDMLHEGGWGVLDEQLYAPLRAGLRALGHQHGVDQDAAVVPHVGGVPITVCGKPPRLDRTFGVTPQAAADNSFGTLRGVTKPDPEFADVQLRDPYATVVEAGMYMFEVTIEPETPPFPAASSDALLVRPRGPAALAVDVAAKVQGAVS